MIFFKGHILYSLLNFVILEILNTIPLLEYIQPGTILLRKTNLKDLSTAKFAVLIGSFKYVFLEGFKTYSLILIKFSLSSRFKMKQQSTDQGTLLACSMNYTCNSDVQLLRVFRITFIYILTANDVRTVNDSLVSSPAFSSFFNSYHS